MKETTLTASDITPLVRCGNPVKTGFNWIGEFFRVNADKNLNYLMKSKRFKKEEEEYELITVNLQNGMTKKLLFRGEVCMHQEYSNKRGGSREGAGRKTKNGEKVSTVSFCAPSSLIERIAEEAKKAGITKSEWIVRKLSQNPEL